MTTLGQGRQGFLYQVRPGIKLLAFASLSAAIMGIPLERGLWWWPTMLVGLSLWSDGLSWLPWLRLMRRLTVLFVSIILFHGFFVPGHWLWEFLPSLTQEGLLEGGRQCLRLVCLASLAWVLTTTTTPWQLVAVANHPWLCQRWPGWQRAISLLAMSLRMTGRLIHGAGEVRQSLRLREIGLMGHGPAIWATAANALLSKALQEAQNIEQALKVRGFTQLPTLILPAASGGWWRDGVVVVATLGGWLFF